MRLPGHGTDAPRITGSNPTNRSPSLQRMSHIPIVRRDMATHLPVIAGHAEGFGKTHRTDSWKGGPLITLIVFLTFVVYTTWAALQGNHYYADPYLSPFYSPVLFTTPPGLYEGTAPVAHAWFGYFPDWWPRGGIFDHI